MMWVDMANLIIKESLKVDVHKKEHKSWSPNEALLLQAELHIDSCIVNSIMKS